jgi:hypothetical protein
MYKRQGLVSKTDLLRPSRLFVQGCSPLDTLTATSSATIVLRQYAGRCEAKGGKWGSQITLKIS